MCTIVGRRALKKTLGQLVLIAIIECDLVILLVGEWRWFAFANCNIAILRPLGIQKRIPGLVSRRFPPRSGSIRRAVSETRTTVQ